MSSTQSPIQINPKILSGTPVFAGTRVPVKTLLDYLAAGDNLQVFLDDFPTVTKEQAEAVIRLAEEKLLEYARAA